MQLNLQLTILRAAGRVTTHTPHPTPHTNTPHTTHTHTTQTHHTTPHTHTHTHIIYIYIYISQQLYYN
jgi:hypothetical protein